jgi:hypothetical protein
MVMPQYVYILGHEQSGNRIALRADKYLCHSYAVSVPRHVVKGAPLCIRGIEKIFFFCLVRDGVHSLSLSMKLNRNFNSLPSLVIVDDRVLERANVD